jgi:hypothetical protein
MSKEDSPHTGNHSTAAGSANDNVSTNHSNQDLMALFELYERYKSSLNVSPATAVVLVSVYSALILFGTAGNGLAVAAVARKPSMRTTRNLFVFNLARTS